MPKLDIYIKNHIERQFRLEASLIGIKYAAYVRLLLEMIYDVTPANDRREEIRRRVREQTLACESTRTV